MLRNTTPHSSLSIAEYLEIEERASVRHEYVGGAMVAQAGASRRHNVITMNLGNYFYTVVEGSTCQIFQSDMNLFIADDAVYYPDVMVVCDPTDTDEQYVVRPCLVIEVLSPSTATTDQR